MVPGLTELFLTGCLIELIWTPKSKSNTFDTKNQLADILTKGNFTRDEWNHLLCLFNISHFSSTVCSDTMAKRSQQDSGAERVTANSRLDNINSQEVARPQNFVMGNDETELELSVESRSFGNRVNDQVRKRQKRISNVAGDGEEHAIIWRMFMSVTMETVSH